MNIEIEGTKRILLVEEGQGLSLTTESNQAVVAISGAVKPIKGDTGTPGPANAIAIGTVTGGSLAAATITGTSPNQILNLTLPKGDTGSTGVIGAVSPLEYHEGIITLNTTGLGTTGINNLQGTRYAGIWTTVTNPGENTGPWNKGDILLAIDESNAGSGLLVNKDGGRANWITIRPIVPTTNSSISLTPSTTNNVGTGSYTARYDHTHTLDLSTATTNGVSPNSTAANKIVSAGTTLSGNAIVTGSNRVVDELSIATTSSKGIIQLSGDLAGTATAPKINPSSAVNFNGNQLNGLPTTSYPNNADDAATKQYVDQIAAGIVVHDPVIAVTNSALTIASSTPTSITFSSAPTSIDGVNLSAGNRILVKDQPITPTDTSYRNGIYIYSDTNTWNRADDMDVWSEVRNAYTVVIGGNQIGTSWLANVATTGAIGTTSIIFKQFGIPSNVTAGDGITKSGQTISVRADTSPNASIVVNSGALPSGIAVKFNSNEGLTTTTNGLAVSGIKTSMIDSSLILPTANGGLGVNVSTNQSGARTALGLGNSAVLNTGAASGTVATGNHSHIFKTTQSFAIQGNIVTGSDLGVPIFFATSGFAASNQTSQIQLVKVMYKIGGGTGTSPSATFDIRKAAFSTTTSPSDLYNSSTNPAGLWNNIVSGLTALSTSNKSESLSYTITDTDQIALWVSGINGTPQNLSVTLVFAHTLNP